MMAVPTVCLLTAGKGSRMGSYGQSLNKALLPIAGKATITHIIERFPAETEFVIGVGYLGEQVRDYLAIAHPNRRMTFVEVDNFDGPGSGPGYSLLCCREHLERPFYFVSCDTLWDNALDWREEGNWLGVARVSPAESGRYCNLKIVDERVVELRDKVHVDDVRFQAFVGFCFIQDYGVFWAALENKETVAGEHQISNGIRALIEQTDVRAKPIEWTDVGDFEKYRKAVLRFEDFDFSKSDEALYIVDRRVIKFFVNAEITRRRVEKARLNPAVFPAISEHRGQFYAYEYQPGETLYKAASPAIFRRFLEWLEDNLWLSRQATSDAMSRICMDFYQKKTRQRLQLYYDKYSLSDRGSSVNGRSIPPTSDLLGAVPWHRLAEGIPSFVHGDLQFDNVLYDAATHSFMLLDWRQDFGGAVEFGDLYYDLAKLLGGIILNYDYVKLNLLNYREDETGIFLDFAQRFQTAEYVRILEEYVQERGYDLPKVRVLVGLIYLNMSPLHHYPFDKMLYSLGRLMLADAVQA